MLKHLARNITFASAGGLLENLVAFFFLIYVARILGVEDFGRYALVGTVMLFFQRLINLGLDAVAIRALASDRDAEKSVFQDFIALKFTLAIVAYAALAALCLLLSYDRQLSQLIMISGLDLIFSAMTMSYENLFVARQIQKVPAYFTAANSLMATAIGVIVLALGGSLQLLIIAMTCWAFLFMLIWSGFFCTRVFCFRFTARINTWKKFIVEAVPLAPIAAVSMTNRQINMLLLSKIPGPMPAELAMGIFQPALAITNAPIRIFMRARTVFIAWAASRLSLNLSIRNEYALIMQLIMVIFSAPLAMGLTYFNEEIIVLLFGSQYVGGAQALAILGWGAGLNLLIIVMEGFLFATDHVKKFVGLYIWVLIVNCILCLALIPSWGVNGAACALLATRAMQFVAMLVCCNKLSPEISFKRRQLLIPVLTLTVMLLCAEGLKLLEMSTLPKLISYSVSWGAIVCFAFATLLRTTIVSKGHTDFVS